MRPVQLGRQLALTVSAEVISTKKKATAQALVDSKCMRTCINKEFTQEAGWPLEEIKHQIPIKYTDRMVTEASKIRYMVNLRIKAAGATTVTGALMTHLKSFKIFLGFDWLQAVNLKINWQEMTITVKEGQIPLEMRTAQTETMMLDYPALYLDEFSEEAFKCLPPR
jgi:hypothetical protein